MASRPTRKCPGARSLLSDSRIMRDHCWRLRRRVAVEDSHAQQPAEHPEDGAHDDAEETHEDARRAKGATGGHPFDHLADFRRHILVTGGDPPEPFRLHWSHDHLHWNVQDSADNATDDAGE